MGAYAARVHLICSNNCEAGASDDDQQATTTEVPTMTDARGRIIWRVRTQESTPQTGAFDALILADGSRRAYGCSGSPLAVVVRSERGIMITGLPAPTTIFGAPPAQ